MCLIAVAHLASDRFPLVVAANRDEEYARPTRPAAFWDDVPGVAGGRDEKAGGSWLAITRSGRFAAVTNIRGGAKVDAPSRGSLVSSFVESDDAPDVFLSRLATHADEYARFHLICGIAGARFAYLSNAAPAVEEWRPGVYGLTNAPPGEKWPKSGEAVATMRRLLENARSAGSLASHILEFLGTPSDEVRQRGATRIEDVEREPFVISDRYGTRSSTAIVVGGGEVLFVEQTYGPMGIRQPARSELRFALE